MFIGIIGATGNIGREVVAEAVGRGHRVHAFTRNLAGAKDKGPEVEWRALDVFDSAAVAAELPGLDVLISCYQPGNAAQDFAATVAQSIADPTAYATVARSLLRALETRPRTRLIVVGGAGSLESAPGRTPADLDLDELGDGLERLGLPREYAVAVKGHRAALDTLRTSNRLWTYLSPAEQIGPGERTGRFRIGTDQPVRDADGLSRVSYADAAVALVDEAELPRFVQRRFTIGY
ncbi:NAD(P)H-binding protein [Nocardia yamanashiensis]|uniref:NAD(P)-dependent oxidoreductase n=1 Tax=Nocardia yamanashiensis TaxID=209247 RepID=UPI001E311155|nr:NAD(P)H-binding protein [Nocardia yamanashiensis]UGT42474.1 NAD(P)H-binding protein [Nocardia yamanashiensis]